MKVKSDGICDQCSKLYAQSPRKFPSDAKGILAEGIWLLIVHVRMCCIRFSAVCGGCGVSVAYVSHDIL